MGPDIELESSLTTTRYSIKSQLVYSTYIYIGPLSTRQDPERDWCHLAMISVSILYKSVAGRYRPVRVADGPKTARYRFIKNASWDITIPEHLLYCFK